MNMIPLFLCFLLDGIHTVYMDARKKTEFVYMLKLWIFETYVLY